MALAPILVVLVLIAIPSLARASGGPGWEVTASTFPTHLPPSGSGSIVIDVLNVGSVASSGRVTVTDILPLGVTATEAGEVRQAAFNERAIRLGHSLWECTGNGEGPGNGVSGATVVTCSNSEELSSLAGGGGNPNRIGPNFDPQLGIAVDLPTAEVTETNRVAVAGGGAVTSASTADPVIVSARPTGFGFTGWDAWFSSRDGTLDTQAGSHPYEATFSYSLANVFNELGRGGYIPAGGENRSIEVQLPAGLVGDPTAAEQCTREALDAERCPGDSQVGTLAVTDLEVSLQRFKVFNVVPPAGVPAELGFSFQGIETRIDTGVRSRSDYGLTTRVNDIPERGVVGGVLTLWGVPSDPSHNPWRGGGAGGCAESEIGTPACPAAAGVGKPFLTLPTSCFGPQQLSISADVWGHPEVRAESTALTHDSNGLPVGFSGCENLGFGPSIVTELDTAATDSPTGLTAEVRPSVGGLQDPEGIGTADIRNTQVMLPEGVVVNPGQAAGLESCPHSDSGIGQEGGPSCPPAAKVGEDEIRTPLLAQALKGSVYLLQSEPPNLEILVAAAGQGVDVKLVGNVHLDEATGRLTTSFEETPQLPFTEFKLSFSGGARAALDTPVQCGVQATGAVFDSWGSPFVAPFVANAGFALVEGPGGSPCSNGPLPFAPTLTAGTKTTEAGAFTGFSMHLQRSDGQQRIEKLQFKSPAGLSAMTSSVPLCGEAEASAGTCPASSHIGHAIVESGPGSNPLVLPQPGAPELPIYLTGPYHGAPFGLSIVTPVIAGPFNLGTIVTRAKIEVDPTTAQITVTTDPLPQIVKGVPTDIRSIDAVIDRPGFFFNPTDCTPQEFTGTVTSAGGAATAPVSSPFDVAACRALKFAPSFTASTSGHTSKANGASLQVNITYPAEAQGSEADISKVNLTIPAILPTRLTTLQQACTEHQFNVNPAGCPAASVIATATVHTPVLKSPLTGPAYFVSHGGAAFPDVEMILQGEGVTLIVDGKTQIKKGVTFSRFETVPDEPFSSFEFVAPQGPHSIFTANGNLCAAQVKMPTTLTAQNGAVLTQSTPVEVQGCPSGLKVLSHSIRKRTLTLKVSVPSAGTLTATGKGLTRRSKAATGRSTLTLTLKAKNRHGKLKTKVKLSFVPAKGHPLAAAVAARFRG